MVSVLFVDKVEIIRKCNVIDPIKYTGVYVVNIDRESIQLTLPLDRGSFWAGSASSILPKNSFYCTSILLHT